MNGTIGMIAGAADAATDRKPKNEELQRQIDLLGLVVSRLEGLRQRVMGDQQTPCNVTEKDQPPGTLADLLAGGAEKVAQHNQAMMREIDELESILF